VTPTRGGGEDLTTLLHAFITTQAAGTGSPTSVAAEQMKRYRMCESDHNHFLKLCGLKPGQEELLPAWVEDISKPNMMKDGKHRLIRNMRKDLLYEDHKIPLFPAIFTMIEKKAFATNSKQPLRRQFPTSRACIKRKQRYQPATTLSFKH
jgi:hypothetical protein